MNQAFYIAKQTRAALEANCDKYSAILATFPKTFCGLTPDEAKTPEWRAASEGYKGAFHQLRTFNAGFMKQFKREIAAERKENGA